MLHDDSTLATDTTTALQTVRARCERAKKEATKTAKSCEDRQRQRKELLQRNIRAKAFFLVKMDQYVASKLRKINSSWSIGLDNELLERSIDRASDETVHNALEFAIEATIERMNACCEMCRLSLPFRNGDEGYTSTSESSETEDMEV